MATVAELEKALTELGDSIDARFDGIDAQIAKLTESVATAPALVDTEALKVEIETDTGQRVSAMRDDINAAINKRFDDLSAMIAAAPTGDVVSDALIEAIHHIAGKVGVDMSQFQPKQEVIENIPALETRNVFDNRALETRNVFDNRR